MKVIRSIKFSKTTLLLTGVILLVSAGLILTLSMVLKNRTQSSHSVEEKLESVSTHWVDHCPWTKPGSMEIDWERIRAMSQYTFALNAGGGAANVPVKGQLQVNIEPSQLARIPKTLNVYKLIPMVQSEKEFVAIARGLGLGSDFRKGYICIERGSKAIAYNAKSDTLEYADYESDRYTEDVPDVPSKEKCKQIAMDIARKAGLLPSGAHVIATNQESGTNPKTGSKENVVRRGVVIGIDVDGYKVRGTGMGLRMDIGDKGKLCSFDDNLRKLEPYGSFPVKPMEQALAEAQAGNDTLNLQYDRENPTVNAIDIFYYSDDSNRKNGLLMPVYAFMGPDCCIYIPAVIQQ